MYTYWHHLRAIVASTRLSFRSSVETEGSSLTGRAFSIGTVDRTPVSHSIEEAEEGVEPIGSRDGCAGFTAKICMSVYSIRKGEISLLFLQTSLSTLGT